MKRNIQYLFINKLKFISSVISKLHFPISFQKLFNNFRHQIIERHLSSYFNNIYYKIKGDEEYSNNDIIWIFWWQGNDMPHIVKKCVDSIKENSSNHRVILINKYNIWEYAHIPKYIYNKLYERKITLTHFSDILRFNLLRNYGGLWIDSTMLCTSKLSDKYFSRLYTSGGYNNINNYFISAKWTAFLIGGYKRNKAFVFMDEFFKLYWKYNDYLIDYFLVDYALNFVYKYNIGSFKYYVNNYAYKNNPHLHDLMKIMNNPYNAKKFHRIQHNTNLFKLSYKKNFNKSENSFYTKIIK